MRDLLLDESLEGFFKLWGNAAKEVGVEKGEGMTSKCVSVETEGARSRSQSS